ncbi:probable transmembrane ascorbate ferrireductase 3 [Cajanus cajan]|uniref:Cytochrome b reductase 1 n=1 Tax=Cajanus cajan TaxID=3821 RepID=A0A151T2L1_CAJCA|nr:probable transmembrane ascorbate ferrireductase 3 [Cajanus cajan]KYP61238.1 Cytochrome b reductase 1 [Cajanus cajan]
MNSYGTTVFAHLFGLLALILLLVWLLHYREGIEYDSENPFRVFNVHPFLMFFGFIFLVGQAILAYQTVPGRHETLKILHMTLHLIAIILGIVGICAAFKFHDMVNFEDVYSLHSWIGIGTFCLFGLQWLFGLAFMLQGTGQSRAAMAPWHVAGGRALFFMAICAALTGLMERYTMLKLLPHQRESHLINFTGLAILLFGVFVDMAIGFGRFA